MRSAGNFLSLWACIASQGFCHCSSGLPVLSVQLKLLKRLSPWMFFFPLASKTKQTKTNQNKKKSMHFTSWKLILSAMFLLKCQGAGVCSIPLWPAIEGKEDFSDYLFWLLHLPSDTEKGENRCKNHYETEYWNHFGLAFLSRIMQSLYPSE